MNFVADTDTNKLSKFGAIQQYGQLLAAHDTERYAERGEEALATVVLVQDSTVHTNITTAL